MRIRPDQLIPLADYLRRVTDRNDESDDAEAFLLLCGAIGTLTWLANAPRDEDFDMSDLLDSAMHRVDAQEN